MPKLYLFPATMGDAPVADVIPARNISLIASVSYFVVENIRTARRFLKACDRSIDIDSLHFVELNEHTHPEEVEAMIAPLDSGHDIGVISEAGCPAVADPGADIVAVAQRRGYEVVPLVGPSSIIMSLMASGFNGQTFAFCGYLPIDEHRRATRLKEMVHRVRNERQTQIFIETPYRNRNLIRELCNRLPADMLLCIASDITGPAQSIRTRTIAQWRASDFDCPKVPTIFLIYS